MGRGQADVFVEVEGGDAAEIEALVAVHADEFLIEAERCASGGEAEHATRFIADELGDHFGTKHAAGVGVWANNNFHVD